MQDKPEILKKAIAAEDWFNEKTCWTCGAEYRVLARHVKYEGGFYVNCPSCSIRTSFLEEKIPLSVRTPAYNNWLAIRKATDEKEKAEQIAARKIEYFIFTLILIIASIGYAVYSVFSANASKIDLTPSVRWHGNLFQRR